jgi:adenylate cyclase
MSERTELSIRLLGEIEVVRGGERLELPPSRKVRALLVYLLVTGRPHLRGRLCSIFWDLPDDPRGALRSALSKLRAVIDSPGQQHVIAERDSIRVDATDIEVDLVTVRRMLAYGVDAVVTEMLETAAATFRGEFAEGLVLSNCPDFHAWCMAEREETRRLQVQILRALVDRRQNTPEAALPHARTLARIDPDAVFTHVTLLRLLVATGRQREAEEQHDLSYKLLAETSDDAADELTRTWRHLAGRPEPTTRAAAQDATTELASVDDEPLPKAPPEKPSIIVLPFANMSDDPEQEYVSDGITEDIITDLSQVSAIFVVARNTAFTYKGKVVKITQLARKLKVGYVLEGSVRKAGSRIRITAQLADGVTGGQLWAERFDREFADIFALQDDISKNVVAALKLKLLPEELKAITTRSTSNAQAYNIYLLARSKLSVSWGTKEYLRAARALFSEAVKIDPGYARAYVGMADCDAFLWVNGDLDVSYEHMLTNSSKALELAPNLAEAHASRGVALYIAGHPAEAIAAFETAIGLDSTLFEAHYFYGFCCKDTGDFPNSALHFEQAAELQPANYQPLTLLSEVYCALGQRDRSIATARHAITRIEEAFGQLPDVAEVLAMGAATLVYLKENDRADEWAKRAILLDPESYTVRYNVACAYAVSGKPDVAQECLDLAFLQTPRARRWLFGIAQNDTQLDTLRGRQDFQELMKRLEAEIAAYT